MIRQFSTESGSRILILGILVLSFSLPISQWMSVRILILGLVFSLFIKSKETGRVGFLALAWDPVLYLIVLLVGLEYSVDLQTGWRVVETSLSLIALPIMVSKIEPFKKDYLNNIFLAFSLGVIVASIICLVNAWYLYGRTGSIDVFFFENLTDIIDSHPTYLAYYLIASITFGLYILHYEPGNLPSWSIVVTVAFLFLMLMLTGGTTSFVSMLFILAFFILKFMLDEKKNRRISMLFLVTLMIAGMFAFNEFNRGSSATLRNDSWERFVLWESAIKANPNVLFGVGTGDYRSVLNTYYDSHDLRDYASVNLNSHNQFIYTYFANGLLGLFCLIVLLGRPIYLSVRNGSTLGALIFFPFIIYGVTEVFFGRYQGVVLFALMQQAFYAYYLSYKPSFSLKRA